MIFHQTQKSLPMRFYRFFLAVVGGSCLVVLSAALTRTAADAARGADAAPIASDTQSADTTTLAIPEPVPNADAEHALDRALEALKPERVSWLQMTIWQKIALPGYVYEADGLYRLAPGRRFRMEMHTRLGDAKGTLLMVSDGNDLWQADRSGEGAWENVRRTNLTEVFSAMSGPSASQLLEEFLQRPHFQGMTPLLRNLRQRLIWARCETVRKSSGERIHVVGVWSKEAELFKLLPADQPWPKALPRQCHIYLDGHTAWPRRVEWWGPVAAGGDDRLLVQMEYRDPVFNHPLPPDTCARLFAFQPGDVAVADETARVAAEQIAKARELAAH
jgi:hypothetical protein